VGVGDMGGFWVDGDGGCGCIGKAVRDAIPRVPAHWIDQNRPPSAAMVR
jgi:hypothetical protein